MTLDDIPMDATTPATVNVTTKRCRHEWLRMRDYTVCVRCDRIRDESRSPSRSCIRAGWRPRGRREEPIPYVLPGACLDGRDDGWIEAELREGWGK